jgi:GcrA cell cycle regulator
MIRRRDVAGSDRPVARAAATPGVTVDEAAHARFAATLVARRAGNAELGHGITYNAVIGKIHRLGISDRSPYGGAPARRYIANTRPTDRPVHAQPAAWWFRKGPLPAWVVNAKPHVETIGPDARIPRRQRRSLPELNDETCSWPVGDPRSSRFFFCGAQPLRNKPYCAANCARAYRRRGESTRGVSVPRPHDATNEAEGSVMPSSKTATLRRSTGGRK